MSAITSRSPRPYGAARRSLHWEGNARGTEHRPGQHAGSYERTRESDAARRAVRLESSSIARSAEGNAPQRNRASQYGPYHRGSFPSGSFQPGSFEPRSSRHRGSLDGTSHPTSSSPMSMRSLTGSFSTLDPFDSITRHDDRVDGSFHKDDDPGPRAVIPDADDDDDLRTVIDRREANRRRVNDWNAVSASTYSDIGSTHSHRSERISGPCSIFSGQKSVLPPPGGRNTMPRSMYSSQGSMQSLLGGRSANASSIYSSTSSMHSRQSGRDTGTGTGTDSVYSGLSSIHHPANQRSTGAGSIYSSASALHSDATAGQSERGPTADGRSGRPGGGDNVMSPAGDGLGSRNPWGGGPSFSNRSRDHPIMAREFSRSHMGNDTRHSPPSRKRYGYGYGAEDGASGRGRGRGCPRRHGAGRSRSGSGQAYDDGFAEACRLADEFHARASRLSPAGAHRLRRHYEARVTRITGESTEAPAQRLGALFHPAPPVDCYRDHANPPPCVEHGCSYRGSACRGKQRARW